MVFFKKKKEGNTERELPPLKFPDFPTYEPVSRSPPLDFNRIKEEINIPQRKPMLEKIPALDRLPPIEKFQQEKTLPFRPKIPIEEPVQNYQPQEHYNPQQRNIFVKVEEYHKALKIISDIQHKLHQTEQIIARLNEAKAKEDSEISSIQSDLNTLKTKLLTLDRTLFS